MTPEEREDLGGGLHRAKTIQWPARVFLTPLKRATGRDISLN